MAGSGTTHLRDDADDVVLSVRNLTVIYAGRRGERVQAVSDVSLDARKGETIGLVGESGCGKSSVARAIMQLPPPAYGKVELDGVDLTTLNKTALRKQRRRVQMIFQDPISSLNPLARIRDIVAEGLRIRGELSRSEIDKRVAAVLDAVGLDAETAPDRRPHEFSGGQCQRISIARAMVLEPDVLICDEPVSALDVSVQAQILNLLEDMKEQFGLTMVFIAHDLAVVKNLSDRIVVMYLGKICEVGNADDLFDSPAHPYTRALAQSIPEPDPAAPILPAALSGELPSPLHPPSGCRFRTRCRLAHERCETEEPKLREVAPGRFVACHVPVTG